MVSGLTFSAKRLTWTKAQNITVKLKHIQKNILVNHAYMSWTWINQLNLSFK